MANCSMKRGMINLEHICRSLMHQWGGEPVYRKFKFLLLAQILKVDKSWQKPMIGGYSVITNFVDRWKYQTTNIIFVISIKFWFTDICEAFNRFIIHRFAFDIHRVPMLGGQEASFCVSWRQVWSAAGHEIQKANIQLSKIPKKGGTTVPTY